MSTEDELAELRNELRYLKDRQEILDCIMKQSRGHDRHDVELMTSVYHSDGVDEHGPNVLAAAEYGEWANRTHQSVFIDHLHNITTHTCDVDGDVAHAESYVIGSMRARDHRTVAILGGRYLDRLERRDGRWGIVLRRCTIEWMLNGDTSLIESGAVAGFIKGEWDRSDPSYARPLTRGTPAKTW